MLLYLLIFAICGHLLNAADVDPKDSILVINTTSADSMVVSWQNSQCYKCPLQTVASVVRGGNATLRVDTAYPTFQFSVRSSLTGKAYCENLEITFGESAMYLMTIVNSTANMTGFECQFMTLQDPVNRYTPIIAAVFIYVAVAVLFLAGNFVYKRMFSMCNEKDDDAEQLIANDNEVSINQPTQQQKKKSQRLESIDAFRGLCLCIMIFVNYGAGEYAFFDHAVWNGLHLADLVFPCFMYIMGVSMALSLSAITSKARSLDGKSTLNVKDLVYKTTKRSVLLYFFGLVTSNDYTVTLSTLRILGVLQRFAISYFACAMLEIIHLHFRGYIYDRQESFEQISWKSKVKEIIQYPIQWAVMAIFTTIWLLLTLLLPVPGCPTGYLGPGGLHENASYVNCTGGAAAYIDRLIMGVNHVYQYPTCRHIYQSVIPHDPEGLLGCLTSILLTYLGVSAGHILIHYKEPVKRLVRFVFYGILYGVLALILCKWNRDDGWIPINKNLWSLSFIFALASIAFMLLALSYLVIDVWKIYSGAPFIFPGKNSICIYICHIVFGNYFPVRFVTTMTHAARLSMDLYSVSLWVIVAAILYYKNIFINL